MHPYMLEQLVWWCFFLNLLFTPLIFVFVRLCGSVLTGRSAWRVDWGVKLACNNFHIRIHCKGKVATALAEPLPTNSFYHDVLRAVQEPGSKEVSGSCTEGCDVHVCNQERAVYLPVTMDIDVYQTLYTLVFNLTAILRCIQLKFTCPMALLHFLALLLGIASVGKLPSVTLQCKPNYLRN